MVQVEKSTSASSLAPPVPAAAPPLSHSLSSTLNRIRSPATGAEKQALEPLGEKFVGYRGEEKEKEKEKEKEREKGKGKQKEEPSCFDRRRKEGDSGGQFSLSCICLFCFSDPSLPGGFSMASLIHTRGFFRLFSFFSLNRGRMFIRH